jgi:hypothetical protein
MTSSRPGHYALTRALDKRRVDDTLSSPSIASIHVEKISTSELLKQVKALPRRERQKVFKAILALEESEQAHPPTKTKRVKWPDVEARAKRIFGNRVLPNLVLLDREEETL